MPNTIENQAVTQEETENSQKVFTHYRRCGKKKFDLPSEFYFWTDVVIAALLLVVLIFTFAFRIGRVEGSSMYPTLNDGDVLVISNLRQSPRTGDIVILQVPTYKNGKPLIKRVIASAGQKVKIDFDNWKVWVDGELLNETYINRDSSDFFFNMDRGMDRHDCENEFEVPKGCVFVMGDNRNNSMDSRVKSIGFVDTRYLLGKAVFRLFSKSPLGTEANPLLSPFPQD